MKHVTIKMTGENCYTYIECWPKFEWGRSRQGNRSPFLTVL